MGTVPLSPPGTLAVGNPSEGREQWDAGQARQSSLLSGAPRNFQCPEVSGCLSPKCCPYLLCLCGTIRDSDGKSFRVRSSWALSTARTWLMVEPAQHRQFLGRTCSHSCLEGLTVLGKGLTLTLQGILGDTHSGEIQELKGEVVVVKSSPLNHPLIREQHELPHPCPIPAPRAPGQGGRCGMHSGKLLTFRNRNPAQGAREELLFLSQHSSVAPS